MDDAAEAQVGAVAKQPVLAIARVAGARPQAHRVARGTRIGEIGLHGAAVEGHDLFVGIDVEDPLPGRGVDRCIARGGKIVGPGAVQEACTEAVRDFRRAIGRTGVDDHDLIDAGDEGAQAGREKPLFVADDQCRGKQRARHAGGRVAADGVAALTVAAAA